MVGKRRLTLLQLFNVRARSWALYAQVGVLFGGVEIVCLCIKIERILVSRRYTAIRSAMMWVGRKTGFSLSSDVEEVYRILHAKE